MTADGALAVHHDPVVAGGAAIAELAVAALPASVPLLPEALDVCEGMVVNIEIKNLPGEPGFDPTERAAREVAELVVETGRVPTVVVSSFWPATLEAVSNAAPDLATGLLVASRSDPLGAVDVALSHGSHAIHPHLHLVSKGLVAAAHDAGMVVAAWTVNEPSDLRAVKEAGVDTVITDDVALALRTVGPR